MAIPGRSLLLTDLSWKEVRSHVSQDGRLLVPVGACDQCGPHLPLGSSTVVADAVARVLSREFGVLHAPPVPYGVNIPAGRSFTGAATLREKTLHGLLNDLLGGWEDQGFTEFILLTAQSHDPHVEAMATVTGTAARVRVLDVLDIDFSEMLRGQRVPQHAGEVLTSLMLHLRPEKVNMEAAEDFPPSRLEGSANMARPTRIPAESAGVIGYPNLATAETGERIFSHIVERIRDRIFLAEEEDG